MNTKHLPPLAGFFLAALGIGVPFAQQSGDTKRPSTAAAQSSPLVVGAGERAKNPTTLSIIVDHRKVLGWISGTGDFTGREVKINAGGQGSTVIVQEGNFFTWHYKVEKATAATFTVDAMSQSATLEPLTAIEPNAFFVLDRSVYRPGQELKFAGFLRKVDERGEFVPLAGENVGVTLVSDRKKTTATTIKLTSDNMGRIEGSYKWSEGDVMDDYTLSVTGCKGSAKVSLAEYRKSKIKLKIAGKRDGEKLILTFDAVDFLDKPVPGSKVSFNAQVVQSSAKQTKWTLKGEDFAYHAKPWVPIPDKDDLTEEEALLVEADNSYMPTMAFGGKAVVSQASQELPLDSGSGTFTMDIKKEWLGGRFCVDVQGVLIDANGREQRATHSVPLDESKQRLTLSLPKRVFAVNETITIRTDGVDEKGNALRGKSTVVAMKLTPGQVSYAMPADYIGDFGFSPNGRRYGYGYRGYNAMPMGGIPRIMATAVGFDGDKAELTLPDPGAYKLVVVTRTGDGKSVTDEIGCIVRKADELPGLHLTTDKREYISGENLEAEIQSRFADARILVTLRDSNGVRLWKSLQLAGQTAKLSLRLPEDVRYACDLVIQYVEGNGRVHVADQVIRVVPAHRFISIKAEHKEQVAPGETVKLAFNVNRTEPVDLVVSVYDQSLLGITSDKQTDIRNFYFADERAALERDRDLLRRRLGQVTLGAVVEQAEAVIKEREKSADPRDVQSVAALRNACQSARSGSLRGMDVAALLQVAGLNVQYRQNYNYGDGYHARADWAKAGTTRLLDMVEYRDANQWFLAYRFFNDTLVMSSTHPSYANNPAYLNGYDGRLAGYKEGAFAQRSAYSARGDGAFSNREYAALSASANASFSVEGQAAISHMAPAGPGAIAPMDMAGNSDNSAAIRRDFSDSAFWNARVRTDAKGQATVEFKLPDSLTNWRVVVTAVTKDLQVGTTSSHFRTFKPVMVWPMLPRNFTQGDKVSIFGTVHNHTDKSQTIKTTLKVDNGEILDSPGIVNVVVPAKGNAPVYWTYRAGQTGFAQILMSAECADGSDASLKRLPVIDASVWEVVSKSGFCKGEVKFSVPDNIEFSTASVDVSIAPSLAADMAETLEYLVDYPHGCIEQTMSRFLPAIKVAQILTKFRIKNPALEAKLPKCVDMGIKRLLELQQPDGGWGWNGNSQTHEMMTPYALYGLMEAEKAGYKIPNEQAVQRGLARLQQFIKNMGEAQAADRIYCMYVYSSREKLQDAWWTFIEEQAGRKNLSDYAAAMALEMAARAGKQKLADSLAAKLRARAVRNTDTAHWTTARFSRWSDDPNEITAAVLKACVAHDLKDDMIPESLAYFAQTKRGNRWNSTKDTAMILYAMCDYLAKQDHDLLGEKTATLKLNNNARKQTLRLDDGLTRKVSFIAAELKPGENILRFHDASPGMMFRLNLRYRQTGSDIKAQANGITVQRDFFLLDEKTGAQKPLKDGDTVPRGAYIVSRVVATSNLADQMRYVLVENPKPGSCEIQPIEDRRFQQGSTQHVLREDKEVGVFWHHEQLSGNLQDACVLRCEMSGEFVIAPAHVELMYKPETRGHSATFRLNVKDEPKVAAK